jgi:hypothetical protein
MDLKTEDKIRTMLHSDDPEMRELGFITLKGALTSWKEFKNLRGRSFKGRPFFPYALRHKIKKFGEELKVRPRREKEKKRQKRYLYERHSREV